MTLFANEVMPAVASRVAAGENPAHRRAHAADRTEPLFRPRQRPGAHQGFLRRRARLRGHAAPDFPVSRLLAGHQRQDPGAHGAGRHPEPGAVLPGHAEECRQRQLRRGRPHRVSRRRAGEVRQALQGARRRATGRAACRSRSCSSSSSRIRTASPSSSISSASSRRPTGAARTTRRCPRSPRPRNERPSRAAPRGFAGVGYDGGAERARASWFRRCASAPRAAEAARIMLPETLADLHRTGLLRILQPKRWGGMEFDFVAYVDIPCELARGCASTGWNVANLLIHHWMLALYDERAQEEVWGQNPDALIASGIAFPQGQGRRADGGFVISGRWNFSSGVNVADWNMLAVTVRDGDKVVDHRMCLLHKSEYEVVDDWQVLGMRSHGQHDRGGEGRVRAGAPGAVHVRGARRRPVSRRARQSAPGLPRAAVHARRPRHRRRRGRQRAGRARTEHRGGEGAQHQLHRPEDARLPGGAAAHRRGGRENRRGAAGPAQRLPRGAGDRQPQRHRRSGDASCASSATSPTR